MIHYTCDRCNRIIEADLDIRYVVKLETHAAMEPAEPEEMEDDRDHLMEVEEILERMEDCDSPFVGEDIYQRRTYDMCPECYRQFIKNPLGKESAAHVDFSTN